MSDLNAQILHGFRLPLSVAFDADLLDPSIVLSDDYQLINEETERDGVIDRNVKSDVIKDLLNNGWNIYILTSSQDEADPDTSYFFLYNHSQEMFCGEAPDYETGEINTNKLGINYETIQTLNNLGLDGPWEYKSYWLIESSY